jgi:replicative DNA helicase
MICKKCKKEFTPIPGQKSELCNECRDLMYKNIKQVIEKDEKIKKSEPEKLDKDNLVEETVNMEQVILKGMMSDIFVLDKCIQLGMNRFMFSSKEGAAIFEELEDIASSNIKSKLQESGFFLRRLKEREDYSRKMLNYYNETVERNAPRFSRILVYMEIIKDRYAKDELFKAAESIHEYLRGEGKYKDLKLIEFISQKSKDFRELQKERVKKDIQKIKNELIVIAREVEERKKSGEIKIIGHDIGEFKDLCQALSGLRKGFLYGIAGAPRRGKTTLMLELATSIAAINKIPVLFYTWEQTRKNLTYRLLAKECRINPDVLQRKKLDNDPELEKRFILGWRNMERYMDYFYLIEGSKEDTIERIKAHAYNAMQDFDTDNVAIFVDYIQKMPLGQEYSTEKFKVEEISTRLKGLSLELNCPVIAISSLTKEGCNLDTPGSGARPTMYHCKGSGDIEYDLDAAIILAKDWDDSKELHEQLRQMAISMRKDPNKIPKIDIVNLHLDKNRDAPEAVSSIVQTLFFIEANKFVELGFKQGKEVFRFRKIDQIVKEMLKEGFISFSDPEVSKQNLHDPGLPQVTLKK